MIKNENLYLGSRFNFDNKIKDNNFFKVMKLEDK